MKASARAMSMRDVDGVDVVLPVRHTGNNVPTLTVKITKKLRTQLVTAARNRHVSVSELVRRAIETSLREPGPTGSTAYDLVRDLIEGLPKRRGSPTDRSTNPKYLEDLGLDNRQYREKYGRDRRSR